MTRRPKPLDGSPRSRNAQSEPATTRGLPLRGIDFYDQTVHRTRIVQRPLSVLLRIEFETESRIEASRPFEVGRSDDDQVHPQRTPALATTLDVTQEVGIRTLFRGRMGAVLNTAA